MRLTENRGGLGVSLPVISWDLDRTLRSDESYPGVFTLARQVPHRYNRRSNAVLSYCGKRVRQSRSRSTDGMIDVIGMLKAYDWGIYSASAQGRSSVPGCPCLHGGEGVRTVGRLHPRQAGERLLKQRPKNQRGNVRKTSRCRWLALGTCTRTEVQLCRVGP